MLMTLYQALIMLQLLRFLLKEFRRLSEAGFELRKWVKNSPSLRQFLELMNEDVPKMNSGCIDFPGLTEEKQVLGLDWNVSGDRCVYNFDKFLTKCDGMKLTK